MASTTVANTMEKPKTIVLETPQSREEEHKVFIGNLSFKTTKESLVAFASTSGKIVDATIITKQRRSLGYGFVTFETEEDAQKAAKDLDGKSLDGREINVEVARPKTDTPADVPQKTRKSKSNARRRSKSAAASSAIKEEDSVVPMKKEEEEEEDGVVPTIKKEDPADEKKVEVKKQQVPVKQQEPKDAVVIAADTETSTEEQEGQEKTQEQIAKEAAARRKRNQQKDKKRQNRKKKSAEEKAARATEPSKTTLFVANLPYATTDDDLNRIFKDYKLVSAHVARMNNGCSKGYGFVELESEQEQLKALESVKDVVLEGRAIYLKIALSEQKVPAVVVNAESKQEGVVVVEEKFPLEDKDVVKKEEMIKKDNVVDALNANDTN